MILLDTHVLIWHVNDEKQNFSRKARQLIDQHAKRQELLVSAISFFEIATLERRGRLRLKIPIADWLASVRKLPEFCIEPLTDDIAERAGQFGDSFSGDPSDRMIAATALLRAVPLVTFDEKLREARFLSTIW